MKKLLYILAFLPLLAACNEEILPSSGAQAAEGEEVELRMSVDFQEMSVPTRAFGDDITDFPSLWVVAFDEQGYLVEWAKAYDLALTGNGATLHETEFSVVLHATSDSRTLHFIANYADNLTLNYGHESKVIGDMVVSGSQDVYWHRKVLTGGINAEPAYIAANFRRIPLLRNFAKISVSTTLAAENFQLTGYYVLNVPASGTVAPYSNGSFVNYVAAATAGSEAAKTYVALEGEGYVGTMPDNVTFGQTAAPAAWLTTAESFYMYENTYKGDDATTTTILIKGIFNNSGTETYYRADLVNTDSETGLTEYYHILRNFHYNLVITDVKTAGKSSAAEAMAAAAGNNLSSSVQIKNLSNVSNGEQALYVSYTSKVLVSTDPVVLRFRYLNDVSDATSQANGDVQVLFDSTGEVIDKVEIAAADDSEDWAGWRTVTIYPKALPDYTKVQTLTVIHKGTTLSRQVEYTLRPKMDMTVSCNPTTVAATAGASVTVNISIPDELNENYFPLEFTIEAQTSAASTTLKQYISPANTEVIDVQTDKSIVPGHTDELSYQYVKTLTYEDYVKLSVVDGKRVLPVSFITNTAQSASTVYVVNEYFKDANASFTN